MDDAIHTPVARPNMLGVEGGRVTEPRVIIRQLVSHMNTPEGKITQVGGGE